MTLSTQILDMREENLIQRTREVAIEEKKKTRELLMYLAELERRGLVGKMGFSSTFNYLVKELRYSEGEASCRVRALRLITTSSLAAEKMQTGELGLSHAAKLQSFFKQNSQGQKMNVEEKNQLIAEVSGKPVSLLEKILEQKGGTQEKKLEKITITSSLLPKWQKVKEMHPGENFSNEVLLEIVIDENFRHKQQTQTQTKLKRKVTSTPNPIGRYIPRGLKQLLFERSGSMCEFVSPIYHQRCQERRHLQVDHTLPLALGGKTEIGNLRILCSGHNASESKIKLGANFIAKKKGLPPLPNLFLNHFYISKGP